MGGRGSWSSSSEVFDVNPASGGGKVIPETVIGPRIPGSLAEALGEKGRPMGMARASEGTNPHNNKEFAAYDSNCQRCVLTYEARRRGYDVTALPTYSGDTMPSDYLQCLSSPSPITTGKSVKKVEQTMKDFGAGSRAIVAAAKGRGGHVFIAENVGGKITYIDPQTNKRYSKLRFSHVTASQVIRIDNQQFTEYARNAFTTQRV